MIKMWKLPRARVCAMSSNLRAHCLSASHNNVPQAAVSYSKDHNKVNVKQKLQDRKRQLTMLKEKLIQPSENPENGEVEKLVARLTVGNVLMLVNSRDNSKLEQADSRAKTAEIQHKGTVLSLFIKACENAKMLPTTLDFFKFTTPADVGLEPYEVLLLALARDGQLESLRFIWSKIVDSGFVPSVACYRAAIQCIGHSKFAEDETKLEGVTDTVTRLLEDFKAKHNGKSDPNLFFEVAPRTQLDYNQLLTAVRSVNKDFVPREKSHTLETLQCYSNLDLMTDLVSRDLSKLASQFDTEKTAISDLKLAMEEQLGAELGRHVEIPSVAKPKVGPEVIEKVEAAINELKSEWKIAMAKRFETRLETLALRIAKTHKRSQKFDVSIYPFLTMMPVGDYVEVVIKEIEKVLAFSDAYSPSVTAVQSVIGRSVIDHLKLTTWSSDKANTDKMKAVLEDYFEWHLDPQNSSFDAWCPREAFAKAEQIHSPGPLLQQEVITCPFAISLALGRELFNLALSNCTLNISKENQLVRTDGSTAISFTADGQFQEAKLSHPVMASSPSFYKVYRQRQRHQVEEVKCHPILANLFSVLQLKSIKFHPIEVPMVTPPLPWSSAHRGGYYLHQAELIRITDDKGEGENEKAALDNPPYPVFDSLNQLGCTPWKINRPILDLVLELFREQHQYDSILDDLSVPRHPDNVHNTPGSEGIEIDEDLKSKMKQKNVTLTSEDIQAYREALMESQNLNKAKSEAYSLWCDMLYRLSIANHYRNHKALFFPHNIDFRGRVYPIAPYFNHMGNDLARSLLVFAKGKPLGKNGFDWLKIHCINLTELKKKSPVEERLAYADEVMDKILASAKDPLNEKWWMEAEDPWQTLAACMEIRDALEHHGGPENFVSHLALHQDGSCNGLQHYAALGRDILGATSVNVVPSDRPQDIYGEIANIVERKRAEDQAKAKSDDSLPCLLNGYVKRKVIKQTVMTTVYGVTRYGARLQIAKQLKDQPGFPLKYVEEASSYLADKTFESLNEMFASSQAIQAWFTECAVIISGAPLYQHVQWITPLGLKVCQAYSKNADKMHAAGRNSTKVLTQDPTRIPLLPNASHFKNLARLRPNTMKQRNGFPPNFVHSLDSTHMMLTSLYLWNEGVTYASVHDCYWTHAASVSKMNEVCRQQFVNLHSQPILEDLMEHFIKTYLPETRNNNLSVDASRASILFKAIPKKGDLDLDVVKDSVYFFS